MGEIEGDRFFDPDRFGGTEFVPHLFPFDRQKMDPALIPSSALAFTP
jgi:hypothetical protein